MNIGNISLLNAIVLVVLGLWGYFGSETPSATALIPVVFGGILLLCNPGVRSKNKAIAHIAVLVTLLILLGLAMPLKGAIGRGDTMAILRVVVMLATTAWALYAFIQSFIAVRKQKAAEVTPAADDHSTE
ncbi:hypothetical protein [Roseiconus lacunae]|uniref:DUF2069 domain-containing protein n=1 Tax=Roseiconus lacunae TaxID=2605694 RepID=A0ABT7PFX4_9BACT|nr:hypothetical protein [Roseiconus lacunae]MCD0461466.1 hypothetical protein [Roseiconus lacunae]MDM4015366.1 hypothetical protein [Roseiconus lacunae]WRQ52956.1 hypothetical protein U8335_10460 [Stieleria sp. HD01]